MRLFLSLKAEPHKWGAAGLLEMGWDHSVRDISHISQNNLYKIVLPAALIMNFNSFSYQTKPSHYQEVFTKKVIIKKVTIKKVTTNYKQ